MNSIQRLRARALASGVLVSTPQQRVFSDNGQIEILPGESDSIYVPAYDADAVFQADPGDANGASYINYGPALDAGPWLGFCLDWNSGAVWAGGWGAWHGPGGWYRPHFSGKHGPTGTQPWLPKERTIMPPPSGARHAFKSGSASAPDSGSADAPPRSAGRHGASPRRR